MEDVICFQNGVANERLLGATGRIARGALVACAAFPPPSTFPDPHAQGYTTIDGRDLVATDWNPSWGWGAGNMISTLDDMRIWARALATGVLLTPETQQERLGTTVPMNPEGTAFYGLGLFNAGG